MYHITRILFLMLLALFMLESSSIKVPNGRVCYAKQELSFFCAWAKYEEAKQACKDANSYLIKIDNANISKAVNALIDKSNCTYRPGIHIGATATPHPNFPNNGSKRIWRWLDESKVHLPNDTGYQNWQSGQPNDLGKQEDCLMIDEYTKQWKDSPCHERKNYICQKKITVNIRVQVINKRQCVATADPCTTRVMWRRRGGNVSQNSSRGVYQTKYLNYSILHDENATIGDAGLYECAAWLTYDKAEQKSIPVNMYVNGTPTIVNIRSFACNSSLLVKWKPHARSLEYLHRITANQISFPAKFNKSIEVTPTSPDLLFTEIDGLNSSTEYSVKVVACKYKDNCTDEYEMTQTATTRGKIYLVANAIMQQTSATGNNTCTVTWEWLHDINASYQITVSNTSSKTPVYSDTEYKNILDKAYSFNPAPDQTYEVDVLPVIDMEHCAIPVEAVGKCVGKRQHENNQWKIGGLNFIIVVPSAAVGAVLILSIGIVCFCKSKTKTSSVDDEVNPGTPVPTDYGHLHSSSNQDEVDAEGSSDESVACSTAADPQSFVDGPIYASVYNPKVRVVVEEERSNEMDKSTEQTSASTNTESMVINPIYDIEEASTANHDVVEAGTNDPSTSATNKEDQELEAEDPIYTAVNKVKMKNNKTIRRPTDEDE